MISPGGGTVDLGRLGVRTSETNLADNIDQLGENFADAYIGDCVSKLENVVESYRIVNNFHEGNNTAVISLRDDVQNVREACMVPVDNLLQYSGDLSNGVWQTFGCPEAPEEGAPPAPAISCALPRHSRTWTPAPSRRPGRTTARLGRSA